MTATHGSHDGMPVSLWHGNGVSGLAHGQISGLIVCITPVLDKVADRHDKRCRVMR